MFEIFQYDFMIRAFIAGIAISVTAPTIGVFLVVRRYSLMSDTLSHVALLGVALGFVLQINPLFSAVIIAVAAAFLMEKLRKNKILAGDSILALFLSGSLALALVIISLNKGLNVNFFNFLFGSITTILGAETVAIISLSFLTLLVMLVCYRTFFLISLDEELAKAQGIKVEFFNILLVILSALVVALAIKIIGALLMGALMVIPVLSAMQFKRGFLKTIYGAVGISFTSVVIGLFIAYYGGIAAGGAIVLTALAIFLISISLPFFSTRLIR